MKRLPLILIGVAVLIGLVIAVTNGPAPGGRFADEPNCAALVAAFEAEPVPDSATERQAVGDEYRAKADQLGCE